MPETPQKFGDRLELAMQKKGWNATKLAEVSTISPGGISRHLKQEDPAKPESIEKYRAALGVSSEWLAFGRGEMFDGLLRIPHHGTATLLGSAALERVLAAYEWPDVDIEIVDAVISDARKEASDSGKDRPESAWNLRVKQLLRERTGRAKGVNEREPAKPADLTEESEEVRGARKRPRRT